MSEVEAPPLIVCWHCERFGENEVMHKSWCSHASDPGLWYVPATDSPDREPDAWLCPCGETNARLDAARNHHSVLHNRDVRHQFVPLYRNPPDRSGGDADVERLGLSEAKSEGTDATQGLSATAPAPDRSDGLREALEELVRLKDGPRDEAYRRDKEAAWAAARLALKAESK